MPHASCLETLGTEPTMASVSMNDATIIASAEVRKTVGLVNFLPRKRMKSEMQSRMIAMTIEEGPALTRSSVTSWILSSASEMLWTYFSRKAMGHTNESPEPPMARED